MDQPVPTVSKADVVRVVRREFESDQVAAVMEVLSEYGTEDWHREQYRVCLAVLKLAQGNLDSLREQIEVAKCDYRDVLAYAEYPEYMTKVPPGADLPAQEVRDVIKRDWLHYQSWLKGTKNEQPNSCD